MQKKMPALLVIDIINSTCHPNAETPDWGIGFKKIREMIPKLAKFIEKYRKLGGKVIFVNCTAWDKEHLAENIIELYKNPSCTYYSENPDFEIKFFQVKPYKKDMVITKNSYSAFTN
jgi:nicotinamidase-related amidase